MAPLGYAIDSSCALLQKLYLSVSSSQWNLELYKKQHMKKSIPELLMVEKDQKGMIKFFRLFQLFYKDKKWF
jgi:hypothetical protein